MICVGATLIAGQNHKKYAPGISLPAVLFVNVQATEEVEAVASRELAALGRATLAIEQYKDVTDYAQFQGMDTPEAGAFRDAIETGFGVVVYP